MTKKKRDLSKYVRVCRSLEDLEKQFAADVEKFGSKFVSLAVEHFDIRNPWDQTVMCTILVNMLACAAVNAEATGDNIEEWIKSIFPDYLEMYRKQVRSKR
jgi:hypothetical protein